MVIGRVWDWGGTRFFNFGEDHYTQLRGGQALSAAEPGPTAASARLRARAPSCQGAQGVDLWRTNAPAYGLNGTYGGYLSPANYVQTGVGSESLHFNIT